MKGSNEILSCEYHMSGTGILKTGTRSRNKHAESGQTQEPSARIEASNTNYSLFG